jgi:hypothetical protein
MTGCNRWLMLILITSGAAIGPTRHCLADTFRPSIVAGIEDLNRDGAPDGFYVDPGAIDYQYYIEQVPSREIRNIIEFDLSPYVGMTLTGADLEFRIMSNNVYGAQFREYDLYLYEGNGQADLADFSVTGVLLDTLSYHVAQGGLVVAHLDILSHAQALLDGSILFLGIRTDPITEGDYGTTVGHYQEPHDNKLNIEAIPEPATLLLLGLGSLMLRKRRRK